MPLYCLLKVTFEEIVTLLPLAFTISLNNNETVTMPHVKKQWSMKDHPPMSEPQNDDGYLEIMAKVIFSAGLNWSVVEKKWPDIKPLFVNFSIQKVAKMNAIDQKELMDNPRMIRNLPKITAIIKNANALIAIKNEFGSIDEYLQTTKKTGEENLIKDLGKKFSFLDPSTALMFLYGVGLSMPETMKKIHK